MNYSLPECARDDALSILSNCVEAFPGLLDDTDVSGADLVDFLSEQLADTDSVRLLLGQRRFNDD